MPSVAFFRIRNWSEFQHYSDRNPPWIKIYNRLLSDYEFLQLPDHAKWHLVGLWLLASQTENRLPHDPAYLRGRLGSSHDVDLDLLAPWLEPVPDVTTPKPSNGNTLPTSEHDASTPLVPEEKRREETEAEKSSVLSEPAEADVENSLEDGLKWNARLAPLAREAGGERKVADWLRRAKGKPDYYEEVLIGLVSMRERGAIDFLVKPGEPMSPAILSISQEGQPIERRAIAEYERLGRMPKRTNGSIERLTVGGTGRQQVRAERAR